MADTTTKIHTLLRVAAKDSGASVHEAHLAAVRAVEHARKAGNSHLVARCRVAEYKARVRLEGSES